MQVFKSNPLSRAVQLLTSVMVAGSLFCGCSSEDGTQTFAWPLATASPENTVTQIYADTFASEVSRLSDGRMKIEVYPNSTLGGDRDLLESCADGDIPFVVQNTAPQVTFMKDLAVFDLPCVFDNLDDLRGRIDEPEFREGIESVYTDGGYHLLGIADQGFRVMSTNKKIDSIADFKGQKIRTMENPYHLAFWKALDAAPTPMSFSEVYIGLQQHTIDAQENPYEVIVSNRLYEQQDYVVETNHLPHLITLIVNEEFYQNLSEQDRKIMDEAAAIATQYAREMSDERISEKIEEIENSGTQIVELDSATHDEIRQKASSVYSAIESAIDPSIYQSYTAGILE
ncbi:TRAP transporter substrate-binding protein [Erysipelotrichaceae bacterium RD49]|nr:TRAP transporter substrate-binding protein [Erysipelotrichaceae bacterium RD49]